MKPLDLLNGLIKHSLVSGGKRGWHVTRYAMYEDLSDSLTHLDSPDKKILSISHSQNVAQICGLSKASVFEANYPEHDVRSLKFEDESFDFIFADQVLEHVPGDIFKVFRDLARILRPNGHIVVGTPFLTEIHPTPSDCWRFTPEAYKILVDQAGLEMVRCKSWGNRLAWIYIVLGNRFEGIPLDHNHPLHKLAHFNEERWPISVWMIARKP
jgi:SAM-dependent methyltransferase